MSARRRGANPLLVVGFSVFAITTIVFFRAPMLPDIGRDLSLTAAQLGLFTTTFAVGRLLVDLPAGRMADRFPVGRNMAVAAASVAAACAVVALAGSLPVLLVGAFAMGTASAMCNTVGTTFFSANGPDGRRGAAVAMFTSTLLVGQSVGPAIGGTLTALGSWRSATLVGAGASALLTVTILVAARGLGAGVPKGGGEAAHAAPPPVPLLERVVLFSVPFVMFATFGAVLQTVVPLIGSGDLDASTATIGIVVGLGGVGRFVGNLLAGWVSDHVSRKAALIPGLAVSAVGVALLGLEGQYWAWVAAVMIISLASSPIAVATTILADHAGGRGVGRRLGPFRFVGDLGLIVGPVTVTLILEHAGTRAAVLTVAVALLACTFASAFLLTETGGRRGRERGVPWPGASPDP